MAAPSPHKLACVVLAAGRGTRMRSALPKVLHEVAGRPMLHHVLAGALELEPERIVTVLGTDMDDVAAAARAFGGGAVRVAVQDPPLGTGHAVRAAEEELTGFSGDLCVLYADTPLIRPQTIRAMQTARAEGAGLVVLGFEPEEPGAYGRLILNDAGGLDAIVEARDADPETLAVRLCNSGVMLGDGELMLRLLSRVRNDNAKGEYYLTDIVALARSDDIPCAVVRADAQEVMGVNSRGELAEAEAVWQARRRREAMEAGVTLISPETVFLSHDTELSADVTVEPNVVFGPGVRVESGARIKGFSHLEGAHVGEGAAVGPFARLRPGTQIGPRARVGNFVEVKKATLEEGAKANHLTYIGDARVGAGANVGAGTITCNYDGFDKHFTDIGAGAFIGSNTALVAPVTVAEGAYIGSGTVVTRDVGAGALALARPEQKEIEGWAARFRARKEAKKDGGAS
ncbi:MAG: bifunctional UDP-N-acetylglucosamine diphosphorylase/glucosamine-1-phosphate N-acetyltransferase GlmU [Alphaproteobacteria bacterium]